MPRVRQRTTSLCLPQGWLDKVKTLAFTRDLSPGAAAKPELVLQQLRVYGVASEDMHAIACLS